MRLSTGYSTLQILIHWTIAALVVAQLLTGGDMADAFERVRETSSEGEAPATARLHMGIGATILVLVVLRTLARALQGVPPASPASPRWDVLLSRASHTAMYVLLYAVPLAGLSAWLSKSEAVGELHATLKSLLVAVVLLHIAGALFHQFWLRDNLIARMLRSDTR
ncbi:cytochrome b [Paracoccus sp. S-4012]|uniref:cytochrome b n=1 Tax=Paracoccus sp. S-4012 TaxID=2665648 RepID=UPI0012B09DEF|nr:cytochrome b/b6 domain-containing protein [Paracoccus sp. S-4012]MRX50511.1 cytochrome b [Paracoccus sp. S-4012]